MASKPRSTHLRPICFQKPNFTQVTCEDTLLGRELRKRVSAMLPPKPGGAVQLQFGPQPLEMESGLGGRLMGNACVLNARNAGNTTSIEGHTNKPRH